MNKALEQQRMDELFQTEVLELSEHIAVILDKFNDPLKNMERLFLIEELQHYLMFEKRLTELTEAERESMGTSIRADKVKADKMNAQERDKYFSDIARSEYFRQCAWVDYLKGVADHKPYIQLEAQSPEFNKGYAQCQEDKKNGIELTPRTFR